MVFNSETLYQMLLLYIVAFAKGDLREREKERAGYTGVLVVENLKKKKPSKQCYVNLSILIVHQNIAS